MKPTTASEAYLLTLANGVIKPNLTYLSAESAAECLDLVKKGNMRQELRQLEDGTYVYLFVRTSLGSIALNLFNAGLK